MNLDDDGIDKVQSNQLTAVQQSEERIRLLEIEQAKLEAIQQFVDEIKTALTKVIVSKVESDVTVSNLDEIHLAFRRELKNVIAPVLKVIKQLQSDSKTLGIIPGILQSLAPEPIESVKIENLKDVQFPDSMEISNFNDLEAYFKNLSDTIQERLKFEIPEPKVTVNVPENIPVVNLDNSEVLSALLELKDAVKRNKQRTKYNTTDIVNALKELKTALKKGGQTTYVTSTPNYPDTFPTLEQSPTVVLNGVVNNVTATTRKQVSATSIAVKAVTIKAKSGNTGVIYIGDSSVSAANGYPLQAGESESFAIDDLNRIWFDASVSLEGISYFGVR